MIFPILQRRNWGKLTLFLAARQEMLSDEFSLTKGINFHFLNSWRTLSQVPEKGNRLSGGGGRGVGGYNMRDSYIQLSPLKIQSPLNAEACEAGSAPPSQCRRMSYLMIVFPPLQYSLHNRVSRTWPVASQKMWGMLCFTFVLFALPRHWVLAGGSEMTILF